MTQAAIQGESSLPREKISRIRAGTQRNSASFLYPLLPSFSLLALQERGGGEISPPPLEEKLLAQISTRAALH